MFPLFYRGLDFPALTDLIGQRTCVWCLFCAALAQLQLSQGWWPCRGWLPLKLVAVELVAIRLVAMRLLNMALVTMSGEFMAVDIVMVAMKVVTLRVVAIWCGGHGSWVGGQGGVDVPQGFAPLSPSAPDDAQAAVTDALADGAQDLAPHRCPWNNPPVHCMELPGGGGGGQDVSPRPHSPLSQHHQSPYSHGPMSHLNPALYLWVTSVVTFMVYGHLQLLPCPLSLTFSVPSTISMWSRPSPCPLLMSHHHVLFTLNISIAPS